MVFKGVVKWFSDQKGYGFLSSGDAKDIFVHFSCIDMNGFKTLKEGQKVQYELEPGPKGQQACKVKVID